MNRSRMPRFFLSYLLGAWLLLSLMPHETRARSREALTDFLCSSQLISSIENFCRESSGRAANPKKELPFQQTLLSDAIDLSNYKDFEGLNILSEYIPDFPEELKTSISDKQSFLRKIRHPREKKGLIDLLTAFAASCCSDDCIGKIKEIMCFANSDNTIEAREY